MYELTIERTFCAAHAIAIAGTREPLHGHNWRVRVTVAGESLDADGLLVDFHELERHLDAVLTPLHNANLNDTPPFDRLNPTAEHVARHIAESIAAALGGGGAARVAAVSVTEAPGCIATYRPAAQRV